jgi:hypothetical protein
MIFYRKENLLNNFVLVNGTARCGKSLISPIIASFERVEVERVEEIFDLISVSHHFKGMETDCAVNLLRTIADGFIYDSYLSRNSNFRWSDHSSIFKSPNKILYLKRLFKKEGPETVERIIQEQPIFQSQGHDQMQFVKLLLQSWPGTFRMIEIIRDPIDQIDAWRRRNWGVRYCTDPMARTPCIKFNKQAVPFYAHGWEQEYLEISPMDRMIKMLHSLQFGNRAAYELLNDGDKQKIRVIRFEDFVANTYEHVDQLAVFLNTVTTKTTNAAIHKQGCPRHQSQESKIKRYEIIRQEATAPYIKMVDEMIEDYKVDWGS